MARAHCQAESEAGATEGAEIDVCDERNLPLASLRHSVVKGQMRLKQRCTVLGS